MAALGVHFVAEGRGGEGARRCWKRYGSIHDVEECANVVVCDGVVMVLLLLRRVISMPIDVPRTRHLD
jgi:hypothetical protein